MEGNNIKSNEINIIIVIMKNIRDFNNDNDDDNYY